MDASLLACHASPAQPVISPDGQRVAYIVSAEPSRASLWAGPADGSGPAVALTTAERPVRNPRWAPDSASVTFLAGPQLCRADVPGGTVSVLLQWRGDIGGHEPLPGGRLIALIAADEPGGRDAGDDAIVWSARLPPHRLRLLSLETGELTVVPGLGDRHVTALAARPDGRALAVISWETPELDFGQLGSRLHVADLDTGELLDLGGAGLDSAYPAWWRHDDGWHVAYLRMTPPGLVAGYAVFDAATCGGPHRNLTEGMAACPLEVVQAAGGPPFAVVADGLDTALYRLDPSGPRFRLVAHRKGRADTLSIDRSAQVIACVRSTAAEPAEVHAGKPGGELARVSDTARRLREQRWGHQERLSYRAADGLALDALLILPPGRGAQDGPFPLITRVHGGPYYRAADDFNPGDWRVGQWLAAAGYAVFLPNPRGSMGRGHEFAALVDGAVGMGEWTDILSGIDLLIAGGVADPGRLGICGWSHGGFMTAWAVGQTNRFRAAVMGAGIADWGMQAGTGEFGILETGFCGGAGWDAASRVRELSPITYASAVRTPVLMLHGKDDTNVPPGQSVYFYRALRHSGVPSELVMYPGEGHAIWGRAHRTDVLRRTREWFDRFLVS